ncbi:oligogalacturonate lyase family protein [Asticcacaulis sp. SL142]|uniref:oligogalacturonate lyase family protein n=1 Tax=Asticcacaulis sp. SL142 TaxID=2995155 RepID=UPI00226D278A|nr:oligogalacturonate lyase family protein [Asticcacaulis sp. SL142]WAC47660.1 oligogalacturonate lyase family protein [Asticcacaulis sp. SL142]
MQKRTFLTGAAALAALSAMPAQAQTPTPTKDIPVEWVDADTGHRVCRVSTEDNSKFLYFHDNAFTGDGKWMVFNGPNGVMKAEIGTWKVSALTKVKNAHLFEVIMVSRTKPIVYVRQAKVAGQGKGADGLDYYAVDINTGKATVIAKNVGGWIGSVNADDTLLLGVWAERHYELQPGPKIAGTDGGYNAIGPDGKPLSFAAAKEVRMADRLAQNIPMEIFTLDIKTGERKVVTASTDWLNHIQFSPTDPQQIMYCHEGPWHMVDRIWTIRADGTDKRDIHKRTMNMEIAGHEFFSFDGEQILYDLQTPRGEDFWLASYNLKTGKRIWYHMERNEWSVHFQISRDGKLFAGDGGDEEMVAKARDGKWLYLFEPEIIEDLGVSAPNAADLVRPGVLRSKKILNMAKHDYRVEPNLQFTPDGKWLLFRSNMHGPIHTYALEVEKSA